MPSDALVQLSDVEAPLLELVADRAAGLEPNVGIPDGVTIADGVDMGAADPALADTGRRVCVALTKAGARCSAPALRELVLCSAHSGRLDARAGGMARAQNARLEAETAQNRAVEARLGARGIIAAALREKGPELRLAIHSLADRAAAGDRQAALAIIPFMTQALGAPSSTPTEVTVDGDTIDLSTLDTASLRALLAR